MGDWAYTWWGRVHMPSTKHIEDALGKRSQEGLVESRWQMCAKPSRNDSRLVSCGTAVGRGIHLKTQSKVPPAERIVCHGASGRPAGLLYACIRFTLASEPLSFSEKSLSDRIANNRACELHDRFGSSDGGDPDDKAATA